MTTPTDNKTTMPLFGCCIGNLHRATRMMNRVTHCQTLHFSHCTVRADYTGTASAFCCCACGPGTTRPPCSTQILVESVCRHTLPQLGMRIVQNTSIMKMALSQLVPRWLACLHARQAFDAHLINAE